MRAEKVIRTLLLADTGVTALVAARIYPAQLPQGTALPALIITHISTIELPTLDAQAAYSLMRARIEVTAIASDYATQKNLLEAVRKACNYQRGTIAGVSVASVRRDTLGPDLRNDDMQVFTQTLDFFVTYKEE